MSNTSIRNGSIFGVESVVISVMQTKNAHDPSTNTYNIVFNLFLNGTKDDPDDMSISVITEIFESSAELAIEHALVSLGTSFPNSVDEMCVVIDTDTMKVVREINLNEEFNNQDDLEYAPSYSVPPILH